MASETVRVWVSKYALTRGLFAEQAARYGSLLYLHGTSRGAHLMRLGRDSHLTRGAAVADAEKRRARKIASLKRQIAKLEAMTFAEVSDGDA